MKIVVRVDFMSWFVLNESLKYLQDLSDRMIIVRIIAEAVGGM